jgi:hypothetical protein
VTGFFFFLHVVGKGVEWVFYFEFDNDLESVS